VTERRAPILSNDGACDRLRAAFRDCLKRWPFRVDALVMLPDHLHAMWTLPPGDVGYSKRWWAIKEHFTQSWLAAGGTEQRGVWQRRFWEHALRDERDYSRHFDYLHFNPVQLPVPAGRNLVVRPPVLPHPLVITEVMCHKTLMILAQSKLTSQGQISVPVEVRRRLGIGPGSVLEWDEEGERIVVRRVGLYGSEQIHRELFAKIPKPRSTSELKEGIRRHMRKKHARG
jgi:AbrB family looped-hinge helix DNA binding protein